jgi:hypothetical protein
MAELFANYYQSVSAPGYLMIELEISLLVSQFGTVTYFS